MPLPCNKEHMQLWVDALRSGRYPQGRNSLQQNGRFCCLGVSCEVAIENGEPIKRKTNEFGVVLYDDWSGSLPSRVADWLGTPREAGNVVLLENYQHEGNQDVLWAITANDRFRWDFNKIADALEQTYLIEQDPANATDA